MKLLYNEGDRDRAEKLNLSESSSETYRTDWRRDCARLIHSPSFRRLQGKTQLFPSIESDFFRNRLTHSLEVAQIAKSIAILINHKYKDQLKNQAIEVDLIEFAGLAHDLGHPPFGHQGEEQLDECLKNFGGFEGNAQTLRILSRIEKKISNKKIQNNKDDRVGLNLCYRTIASILKYDNSIPLRETDRKKYAKFNGDANIKPVKGYYSIDNELVESIKKAVLGIDDLKDFKHQFKTIECGIMDIADDIAYSTYDLEDGLKAGFLNPAEMAFNNTIIVKVKNSINRRLGLTLQEADITDTLLDLFQIFNDKIFDKQVTDILSDPNISDDVKFKIKFSNILDLSKELGKNGYLRTQLTSKLVDIFIKGVEFEYNMEFPALSSVKLVNEVKIKIEILKRFVFESQILSPRLKIVEYRGKQIIKDLFETLSSENGFELLPDDYRELYELNEEEDTRKRIVGDFISGMTDRYALEFYCRLKSENPESFFKPF